ncbi:MAG: amidophosphoribosyltransferase [Deltaproteobacteria bacterium]|nr:amidophosphoribosyltransferase [Deltaproteobacteria bacterium]MBN2673629.1 amidophosphoribosyltransferase [Deltaproteobacteria bacterium]
MSLSHDDHDHFRDECGVFAIVNHPEAANLTYLGLHGLQHRGQESAGIVTAEKGQLYAYRRLGLVSEIFTPQTLDKLPGRMAIGHVRYSTSGESSLSNAQPLTVHCSKGSIAVAHNGNLTNALHLREELENQGAIFQTTTDTEVLVHQIARSGSSLSASVCDALYRAKGAYSILFLSKDEMICVRDPHGIRPLCIGKLDNAWVVSSESVAFDLIGAEFVRDVDPGEMLAFSSDGAMSSSKPFAVAEQRSCLFEYVYFARPDSTIDKVSVYFSRKRMGAILAEESPVEADIVIPVPDSGMAAALGYSERAGIPFEQGLIRSHYVGRTFIEPKQSIRNFGVKLKLNPSRLVLKDKRVIVVDDSLVRGTTSRKIIENIRKSGAREVHFRVSSPPIRHSCKYGIDTPTDEELIANEMSLEEIAQHIGVDSIAYLSIPGLKRAVSETGGFCTACFDGDYPVQYDDKGKKLQLRFEGL